MPAMIATEARVMDAPGAWASAGVPKVGRTVEPVVAWGVSMEASCRRAWVDVNGHAYQCQGLAHPAHYLIVPEPVSRTSFPPSVPISMREAEHRWRKMEPYHHAHALTYFLDWASPPPCLASVPQVFSALWKAEGLVQGILDHLRMQALKHAIEDAPHPFGGAFALIGPCGMKAGKDYKRRDEAAWVGASARVWRICSWERKDSIQALVVGLGVRNAVA